MPINNPIALYQDLYGPSAGDLKIVHRKLDSAVHEDDFGWLWLWWNRSRSIGPSGSGAMTTGDKLRRLFLLQWELAADGVAGYLASGSATTAAAAWDAGETVTIPDPRSRAIVVAGQGPGLSDRGLGSHFGEEEHTMLISEMPEHGHILQVESVKNAASETSGPGFLASDSGPLGRLSADSTPIDLNDAIKNTGGGNPFNVTQASFATNLLISLGER